MHSVFMFSSWIMSIKFQVAALMPTPDGMTGGGRELRLFQGFLGRYVSALHVLAAKLPDAGRNDDSVHGDLCEFCPCYNLG